MTESLEKAESSLRQTAPEPEALQIIPEAMARKHMAIPLEKSGNILRVAMANPTDIFALEALASWSQLRIEPEEATAEEVLDAIDFNYKAYDEIQQKISSISDVEDKNVEEKVRIDTSIDAPVAQALTMIVDEAVKARASDVHLQPGEDNLRVRYRIDGALHDMFTLPLTTATALISRIKVLAKMNIADHHRPQDGQFTVKTKGRNIDVRVGSIATVNGEMATLRLLDKSRATLALVSWDFYPTASVNSRRCLKYPTA